MGALEMAGFVQDEQSYLLALRRLVSPLVFPPTN